MAWCRTDAGVLGKSRKNVRWVMVSKFQWSAGTVLKIRRIKHSAKPLSK